MFLMQSNSTGCSDERCSIAGTNVSYAGGGGGGTSCSSGSGGTGSAGGGRGGSSSSGGGRYTYCTVLNKIVN